MTKIEKLKAAFEAATQGEWRSNEVRSTVGQDSNKACAVWAGEEPVCSTRFSTGRYNETQPYQQDIDAKFIALAHNLMPQLLELVDTLGEYLRRCTVDDEDRWITREFLHEQMKKLKES